MNNPTFRIERVYDDPEGTTGGFRVFVDRLWPRGESKAKFHYDLWAKDVPHLDIVLLTGVRDVAHSHVPILADLLRAQL